MRLRVITCFYGVFRSLPAGKGVILDHVISIVQLPHYLCQALTRSNTRGCRWVIGQPGILEAWPYLPSWEIKEWIWHRDYSNKQEALAFPNPWLSDHPPTPPSRISILVLSLICRIVSGLWFWLTSKLYSKFHLGRFLSPRGIRLKGEKTFFECSVSTPKDS